jgi:T5SS/PEP-CTERM-associated repeat protein
MSRPPLRRGPSAGRPFGPGRGPLAAALVVLALAPPAPAQSTWNNAAGGNWSVGSNWSGGTAPTSGTSTALTFGSPATQTATYTATNNIADPFTLNSLTFNNTAGTVTLAGGGLTVGGTGPTVTIAGAGTAVVNPSVTLASTTTVTGMGTGAVTLGGAVSGGLNDLVNASSGGLTLAAGGTLNRLVLQGGATTASGGTLALTFVDPSDPTSGAGLFLGTAAGQTATFTASGGAKVNVTENVAVGDFTGSTGTVTVSGAGTALDNTIGGASGLTTLANNGTGTLTVTTGGGVTTRRLDVGVNGAGTVNVQSGGTVRVSGTSYMGQFGTSTATVTVTGAGSSLSFTGPAGSPATLVLTSNPFASGIVPGVTTVTVSAGGSLAADILNAGQSNGSTGTTVTVTDAGSTLTAGLARVGGGGGPTAGGPTTLNILAGGAMTVTGNLVVYGRGTVNVNAGTLRVGGLADGLPTSVGNIALTGSTLTINTIPQTTPSYSGVISGTGGLGVTGTGAQILAGANTYSGGTTVSGGRLLVTTTTGSGTGTGAVTVSSGGTLGGTGTVGGAATVNSGGTLAPGLSPGVLTVTGGVTFTGGTLAVELNGATAGTGYDQLASGGPVNLGVGVANLALSLGYAAQPADTLTVITATPLSGTFANVPATGDYFIATFNNTPYRGTIQYNANSLVITNLRPVPEPGHVLLVGAGLTAAAGWWNRRGGRRDRWLCRARRVRAPADRLPPRGGPEGSLDVDS